MFMGVAQIMLDDLDLSNIVIGWYKLFGTSSLVSVPPNGPTTSSATTTLPTSTHKSSATATAAGSVHSLDSYG